MRRTPLREPGCFLALRQARHLAGMVLACALIPGISLAADGTWTGGAGATWSISATNWTGVAGTPWDGTSGPSNSAIFTTAGATPSISGTVYANGIIFGNTATISGGTINLAGITPTIAVNADATVSSVLNGSGGFMQSGTGVLTLSGALSNTLTGPTSVSGGRLHLAKWSGAVAVAGNLAVTGGQVTLASNGQLASTSAVSVSHVSGVLNGTGVNASATTVTQTIASLAVAGGTFNTGFGSNWTVSGAMDFTGGTPASIFVGNSASVTSVGSLSLVGMSSIPSLAAPNNSFTIYGNNASVRSTFTVGSGGLYLDNSQVNLKRGSTGTLGSRLVLGGDITTGGAVASAIRRDGLETDGLTLVELGSTAGTVERNINVAGGGADLTISVSVTNGASSTASLRKSGAGILTLSGAEANTYSGTTSIDAGTLRLSKSAGLNAVAGNIVVNTGGTLQLSANDQIADSAGITFSGGSVTGWSTNETIAFLTQNAGGSSGSGGNTGHVTVTGALTLAGGNQFIINSSESATPSSWHVGSASLTGADILIGGNNGAGNPRTSLTIGAGGLTMNGRTITMNRGTAGVTLNLNGNFTGSGTNNIANGGGSGVDPVIDIGAASRTLEIVSGNTIVGVEVTGSGSLSKSGTGTLTLSGTTANTYSGGTTVNGGILVLSKTAGVNAIAGNMILGDGIGGDILRLDASNQIADTSVISFSGNAVNARGDFRLNGQNETIGGLASSANGHGLVQNTGAGNSVLTLDVASGTQTFSGEITNSRAGGGGTLGVVKTGAGTQVLAANSPVALNAYTGGTQINGGRLQVDSTQALGASGNIRFGGGTLQYTANSAGGTDYSARIKNSANAIAVDTNGQSVTFGGAIDSSNTAGLAKNGAGTLTLAGTNTYTGLTTVNEGKLILNGSIAGGMEVASGATLGGSGTIAGPTTILSGGTHSPGNSPGVLTHLEGLTLHSSSTFVWELAANTESGRGTSFDGVDVTGGTLTIQSGVISSLVFNGAGSSVQWSDPFWDSNHSWWVFDNANAPTLNFLPGIFGTVSLSNDSVGNALGSRGSFAWSQSGNDIYLNFLTSAVPEPGTGVVLALAVGMLGLGFRRRRCGACRMR